MKRNIFYDYKESSLQKETDHGFFYWNLKRSFTNTGLELNNHVAWRWTLGKGMRVRIILKIHSEGTKVNKCIFFM